MVEIRYNDPLKNRGFILVKGYLFSALLLALGLAGVGTVALQASRSLTGAADGTRAASKGDQGADTTPPPRERPAPRRTASPAMATRPAPDAGAPRPTAEADAGAPRPTAEADAAAPAVEPPRPAGPAPALVIEFQAEQSRPSRAHRAAVRALVDKHGYKGTHYELVGYAAERHKPRYNRALARKRCRRVSRLIRKRGVSRRWIKCADPVFRKKRGKATEAHLTPAWRRVVIRVEKR